jgi:hypothetical protein
MAEIKKEKQKDMGMRLHRDLAARAARNVRPMTANDRLGF